jgi:hypothetical protein
VASEVMEIERADELFEDAAVQVGDRIYKVDSTGALRVWFMERQGHKHRVVSGIDGGALVRSEWTVCGSKGKGKAQTTPEEQSIKEVDGALSGRRSTATTTRPPRKPPGRRATICRCSPRAGRTRPGRSGWPG